MPTNLARFPIATPGLLSQAVRGTDTAQPSVSHSDRRSPQIALLIAAVSALVVHRFFRFGSECSMEVSSMKPRPPCTRLTDLTTDPHNANRGTDRGRDALTRSLREYGPGRAIVIDRHGRIIAGNKTVEQAKRLNIPLRVIQSDGHHLIALQRQDLDLATDPRARALAIAENRVGELDLEWDVDMLKQLQAEGLDLSAFWTDAEFATLFAETTTGLTDENAVVEPGSTDIVRGELFILGQHRLLCGDATSAGDVTLTFAKTCPG
jgi:hypothetical protein